MADVTISSLPAVTSPSTSLQLPVTDGTTTSRMSVSQILGLQSGVPIGTIVMWSNRGGAGIPSGWQICDGTNGTPDLRDRFIVGSGNTYAVGNTGGVNSVTPSGSIGGTSLTASQQSSFSQGSNYRVEQCGACNGRPLVGIASTGGPHTHTLTMNSQTNLPPYYALAYIQKIS